MKTSKRYKIKVLFSKLVKLIDKAVIGNIWALIGMLLTTFFALYLVFYIISYSIFPENTLTKTVNTTIAQDTSAIKHDTFNDAVYSRSWGILSHFLDPGNIHMASPKARYLAAIIAFFGSILFGGFIISSITNLLERRVDRINAGKMVYRFKDHLIILGWSDQIIGIIQNACTNDPDINIVIQTTHSPKRVKQELDKYLGFDEMKSLVFYYGNRNSMEDLGKLGLEYAKTIYIVGDKDEQEIESKNLDALNKLTGIIKNKRPHFNPINCFVILNDPQIYTLAQDFDLEQENINLFLLNKYEEWSRQIFANLKTLYPQSMERNIYPPIFPETAVKASKSPVLFIAGFGKMGQSLLLQAIRFMHFKGNIASRVILIDKNINELFLKFKRTYPGLNLLHDIKIERWNLDFYSDEVHDQIEEICNNEKYAPYIIVSFRNTANALKAGFNLPVNVYKNKIPLLVRQEMPAGIEFLIKNLQYGESGKSGISESIYSHIKYFGNTQELLYNPNDYTFREALATAANATYAGIQGKKDQRDSAIEAYISKAATHKWSNRYFADGLVQKLQNQDIYLAPINKSMDYRFTDTSANFEVLEKIFDAKDVEEMAIQEHNRWVGERIAAGWYYDTEKNDRYKTRNNMLDWDSISDDNKNYDRNFIKNLLPNIKMLGYVVLRKKPKITII